MRALSCSVYPQAPVTVVIVREKNSISAPTGKTSWFVNCRGADVEWVRRPMYRPMSPVHIK
jgi:hypothetical protein